MTLIPQSSLMPMLLYLFVVDISRVAYSQAFHHYLPLQLRPQSQIFTIHSTLSQTINFQYVYWGHLGIQYPLCSITSVEPLMPRCPSLTHNGFVLPNTGNRLLTLTIPYFMELHRLYPINPQPTNVVYISRSQ